VGDWDADPQREAYQRAMGDYIEFAKIVQHYDKTARPAHDDIDFEAGDLTQLDGEELDMDGNPVIQLSILFIAIADAIEDFGSWDDIPDDYEFTPEDYPEDAQTVVFFDDYDEFAKHKKRCRRKPKDDK